ncbi:hypothetical protein OsJ_28147 [Oryza sativa Japonica Group]|nr:hypothetical protein OsJ_28147 [Oryza sativa Japonica Group]BAD08990.1 putative NBS-LRR resistance protein RGH1 [Oryza sativa Japonica Group]BAD09722.1 putative NBS-LRR resistance protein RGH1 [Oryza sativa Japonica Group]
MAESLLLPVVRGVAGKAADALVQSVTRMCGIDGDRRKLERQLLAVQCKLADAEAKSETNPAVKRWMKDLKAVAYEADDVLDDFEYEALRREVKIGDSTTRKVLGFFTPHSPLLFRVTMSRKLGDVLKKINELVEEMNKFGLMEHVEVPQLPYRLTHSGLDESADIFGREHDKEVLVKLTLDQHDQQNLQVLPIVGMGGLGKTTLAKLIYNDPSVQEHFQLKMWHCVSENFEVGSLLKSIVELATNRRCQLINTIELLRRQLEEAFGRRRFLLVLDDVWNDEENKWADDLKPLLNSVGGAGSVIVVTTRSQRVASIMGTLEPYELRCLNEDDSWEVFSKRAFGKQVQEQAKLVSIGTRIVKKCRGVPLALKTMGGLMSSKQSVSEWEVIAESNIGARVQGKNDVMDILKLSYRHLSPEMKQCFAFCAIFPQDYEMVKDELIQLWMANGFIQEEENMDLTHKGEMIFHDLVWRSFLQDVKEEFIIGYHCDSIVCKMHDLMHDLAKDVTDECASTTKELDQLKGSIKDVRHLRIPEEMEETMTELFKGTSSLHTLIDRSWRSTLWNVSVEFNLASVRALRCSVINSAITNAKHIRFLDLSETSIVRLPDSICMLYNLQSLRLNSCDELEYLPKGMRTMRKLIHIYLYWCDSLRRMPPNIGLLNNLRTLTTYVVDTEAGCGIEELKDLQHLTNRLELYNLHKVKSEEKAKQANMYQKKNLSEVLFFWGRQKRCMPNDNAYNEERVLESLAPYCSNLKVLELHGYGGVEIPEWMRDPHTFQRISKLNISNCPRCKDLPPVWLLVSLEELSLSCMDNLTTLCTNDDVEAEGCGTSLQIFPKLKKMFLRNLPNLERWAVNISGDPSSFITLPQLEILRISDCPKLAGIPDCPVLRDLNIDRCSNIAVSSLAHVTSLSYLSYDAEGFDSMTMPLGSWSSLMRLKVRSLANMVISLEDQQNQGESNLVNLRRLNLHGPKCFTTVSGFSELHHGIWVHFAFVEHLVIGDCHDIVRWPTEELRCLIRLRSLHIFKFTSLGINFSLSEEILYLSCLEELNITSCSGIVEIPKLPASLEELFIQSCQNLVVPLPPNLGNLASLRNFIVIKCESLKLLPDGMDGLTSLRKLHLDGCRG